MLSKFSCHTHRLQNGGHPRLWARLPKSVHNPMGGGGKGCEGEEMKRRPAALVIASGGGGQGERGGASLSLPLTALHIHAVSLPFLFLISPFCCRGLFRYKKAHIEPYTHCITFCTVHTIQVAGGLVSFMYITNYELYRLPLSIVGLVVGSPCFSHIFPLMCLPGFK
jgi:hypothetical protein